MHAQTNVPIKSLADFTSFSALLLCIVYSCPLTASSGGDNFFFILPSLSFCENHCYSNRQRTERKKTPFFCWFGFGLRHDLTIIGLARAPNKSENNQNVCLCIRMDCICKQSDKKYTHTKRNGMKTEQSRVHNVFVCVC